MIVTPNSRRAGPPQPTPLPSGAYSDKTNSPSPALPGARPALVLLLAINLFNYIDRQVLAAVVPNLKQAFFGANGTTRNAVAGRHARLVSAAPGLQAGERAHRRAVHGVHGDYMIGAPVFGRLAERRSRWMLMGVGVVLWSLASGGSGLAVTFGMLLLTRCFVGIGEAAYGPVAPTVISDFYPVKVRGQVLAWFYMAIPVGSALGYVIGESVAKSGLGAWGESFLGLKAESWRWAFYLVVPPGILLGLWSFFMREPPRGQADLSQPVDAARSRSRDYLILLRTPSYVLCTLGMAAMTFAMGGIAFWMPYYLESRPGVSGSPTTTFGVITVVAGLTATLLGGWMGDKLRARFPGSYFLVSGTAMLAGFPLFLAVLKAPFPVGVGAHLLRLLLPVLQHRPDQHHSRERHAPGHARDRLRAEHLRHPRAGRCHFAGHHRHPQRPLQHGRGFPGRGFDVPGGRRAVVVRRAPPGTRYPIGRHKAPNMILRPVPQIMGDCGPCL